MTNKPFSPLPGSTSPEWAHHNIRWQSTDSLNFHFHPGTGEITSWDNSNSAQSPTSHFSGHVVAKIEFKGQHSDIDPRKQKIDVLSRPLRVVDKTPTEKAMAMLPTLHEVKCVIARDLEATDSYAVPDRPMSEEQRIDWKTYRQSLRYLSKLATPVDMVKAWPVRPDGADAIAELRGRSRLGQGSAQDQIDR
jgi:Phage tail assembly chaperone protein